MTQRIVYTNADGSVSIVVPSQGLTVSDCLDHIPIDATSVKVIDKADLPQNRMFRNAWTIGVGGNIEIDINKAKNVANLIRKRKIDSELAALDMLSTIPAISDQLEESRQSIRSKDESIQININSSQTISELQYIVESNSLLST